MKKLIVFLFISFKAFGQFPEGLLADSADLYPKFNFARYDSLQNELKSPENEDFIKE